jgi:hypothetical protein
MENIKSIEEVATILYNNAIDMDYMDYEDTKEETLNELQEALYQIEAIAKNEYNKDYWRTFWNVLQYQK